MKIYKEIQYEQNIKKKKRKENISLKKNIRNKVKTENRNQKFNYEVFQLQRVLGLLLLRLS